MAVCREETLLFFVTTLLSSALGAPTLVVDATPSNYGSTETLKCTDATYTSGDNYFWRKDGVIIFTQAGELSTTGKYSESINETTFKLFINDVAVSDEGAYTCNHAFADSNSLNIQVESQGTATAKLSSSNLVEVTFNKIYPNTISADITCDSNIVAGSFVSSVADGDRFKSTWQSTNTFSTKPTSCSASVTLRTTFSAGITFATAPTEEKTDDGLITKVVTPVAVGVAGGAGGAAALYLKRQKALIKYCVIIMEGILTWLLGASIGAFWVVTEVLPGGPADGKLKVGYKIYDINDKAVTEENHNKIEEMINDKEILTLRVSKDGIPDTSDVQLKCKKGELLGFEVEHLPMVTEVSDGSKADGKLEKGDRILSINGKSTTGKSIGDINKQLKIPPKVLDLSLKRGEDKKHVTLDFKGKASSGIAIKKEKEDIVVSTIEPESAAAISGEIQEKDIILSVNGVSTTGMKDADIKEMLKFSIILKVTKDVTLKELDPDHNGSFGVETFPTNSTREPANMVDTVTHDGPAQHHGIKPGDTIVSINGKKTKGKSHQEIEAMLKTFGTSISLEIKKGGSGAIV